MQTRDERSGHWVSIPFVLGRVDPKRSSENGPPAIRSVADRSLQRIDRRQRPGVSSAKMGEREPALGRGGQSSSQRVAIHTCSQFAEGRREHARERRRTPQIRGNAIESLFDLLADPDQCRETTARRFGHDLARENWPAWPERRLRGGIRPNDSLWSSRAAPLRNETGMQVPDRTIRGHGRHLAWYARRSCGDARTRCSVSPTAREVTNFGRECCGYPTRPVWRPMSYRGDSMETGNGRTTLARKLL